MRVAFVFHILYVFVSSAFGQGATDACTILVKVVNLRSDIGTVSVALYNSGKGFPEDSTAVFRGSHGRPAGREASVVFDGVPYGYYAIAVLHDENMNRRMDKGLFGIPEEGYGFSNDVMGFMGPPGFDKASFHCDRDSVFVTIRIRY